MNYNFVERYGPLLSEQDLLLFSSYDQYRNDYETNWYLEQNLKKHKTKVVDKNRRYQALRKLISDTDYFSLENMRLRSPELYQQVYGMYD